MGIDIPTTYLEHIMAEIPDGNVRYFSSYHFARDIYGNMVSMTFLLILVFLALGPINVAEFLFGFSSSPADPSTPPNTLGWSGLAGFALMVIPGYVLLSAITGIMANRFALLVSESLKWKWVKKTKWGQSLAEKRGFRRRYKDAFKGAWPLYKAYFPSPPLFTADDILGQMMDSLISLMRRFDTVGYAHVYRMYSFLQLYRQCFFYTFSILMITLFFGGRYEQFTVDWFCLTGGLILLLWLLWVAVGASTRQAVQAELRLVFCTHAWLTQQQKAPAISEADAPKLEDWLQRNQV